MLPCDWRFSSLGAIFDRRIRASRHPAALRLCCGAPTMLRERSDAGRVRKQNSGRRARGVLRRPALVLPWASLGGSPWALRAAPGRRRCSTPTTTTRRSARLRPSATSRTAGAWRTRPARIVAAGRARPRRAARSPAARSVALRALPGVPSPARPAPVPRSARRAAPPPAWCARCSARTGPSQAYRNVVDRCLRERGYEPVGWD